MPEHEKYRRLLARFLEGGLDEDELEILAAHLEECEECSEALSLSKLLPELKNPDEDPPASLASLVIAKVTAPARRRRRTLAAALAAAAVLAVALVPALKLAGVLGEGSRDYDYMKSYANDRQEPVAAAPHNPEDSDSGGSTSPAADDLPQGENAEPPATLRFDTLKDLDDMLLSVSLSDSELTEYLVKNDYSMNGIDSRDDIYTLAATLSTVPFPAPDGGRLVELTIYPDNRELTASYELAGGADAIWCVRFDEGTADERFGKYVVGDARITEFESDGATVLYFESGEGDPPDVLTYSVSLDGHGAVLTLRYLDADEAEAVLKGTRFISLIK